MKKILILLTFIFCNLTFSQSQSTLNENAKQEYIASDNRLDFIYKHLQQEYKKDTTFVKNLKNSQRIWIKFRLAELDVKYPNERNNYYGTAYPMCKWIYLKELTNYRNGLLELKKEMFVKDQLKLRRKFSSQQLIKFMLIFILNINSSGARL